MVKLNAFGFGPSDIADPADIGHAENALSVLREGKLPLVSDSGWMYLPERYSGAVTVKDAASRIRSDSAALVVIGAGGSYLGAKAAIELLETAGGGDSPVTDIYFAGNNLSGEAFDRIIAQIGGRDFSINVVSKSGSTLEPLVAFHIFKDLLDKKYGSEAGNRIYVTTDASDGPLRRFSDSGGITSFEIPKDIGGRYSVLTAVGLLPMAVAGIDIDAVMAGALSEMREGTGTAMRYASARQALYHRGKKIEILGFFEPALNYTGQWWKQLFGESEGKQLKGIFPAVVEYSSDLHSMGQYIQEGERTIFETIISFERSRSSLRIPSDVKIGGKVDGLSGRALGEINAMALNAVKDAHAAGGVPVLQISLPIISPESFGALVYFFELSCALSALISGVNPFDQPGVEAYKKNLYSALGFSR